MNNNKQSSVEWLFEQISRKQGSIFQIPFYIDNQYLLKQAKAMHKEEIIKSWMATDNELQRISAEHYYNSTYGGDK